VTGIRSPVQRCARRGARGARRRRDGIAAQAVVAARLARAAALLHHETRRIDRSVSSIGQPAASSGTRSRVPGRERWSRRAVLVGLDEPATGQRARLGDRSEKARVVDQDSPGWAKVEGRHVRSAASSRRGRGPADSTSGSSVEPGGGRTTLEVALLNVEVEDGRDRELFRQDGEREDTLRALCRCRSARARGRPSSAELIDAFQPPLSKASKDQNEAKVFLSAHSTV